MKWQFRAFWVIYLLDIVVTGGFKIMDYVLQTKLLFLFKIPLLLSFSIIVLFHLKNKIKWNKISVLFFIFGTLNLLYGLIINIDVLDSKILPNIYTFLMPIFSISFGIHYAKNYNFRYKIFTNKIFKHGLLISLAIVSLYLFFHYVTGQIKYFGFGNELHFIGAYFLANKRMVTFIICLFFILASGKRSTTLNAFFVAFLYYGKEYLSFRGKNILLIPLLIFTLGFGLKWAYENDYLRRFEETFKFDLNDDKATYRATSGRWQEVQGVVKKLNEAPYKWVVGAGIGGKYIYEDYYYGYRRSEEKHYAHFSPIGYTFLYGLVFTILLYCYLFWYIIKNYKLFHKNFYYLSFSVLIFAAFFGSNLFVDHVPWFFVGIISQFKKDSKLLITKN